MEKEFEESFNEIYEKIVRSCSDKLKEVKLKNNKFVFVVFLVLVILNIIILCVSNLRGIISLSASISFFVVLFFYITGDGNYKRLYKKYVIEELVKGYNNRFYYDSETGITRAEYNMAHFEEKYDEYRAEDRIFGTLETGDNFQLSEVTTMKVIEKKDSSGTIQKTKKQAFRGLYGIIRLKNNPLINVHIASDNFWKRYVKNRIEMDSSEFEKYYDCLTRDKIDTMRIFTSDLIEKYIEIVRDNKYGFELKIVDDMIFLRYKTNQVFEPPMFKTGLEREFLKKNYKVIYYPLEIINATIKNMNEIMEDR